MFRSPTMNVRHITPITVLAVIGLTLPAYAQASTDRSDVSLLLDTPPRLLALNDNGGRLDLEAGDVPDAPRTDEPYHLFNRAPRERLRPIAPEPHPFTTDPGWFQVEIDPLNFTYDRDSDQRTRAFAVPVLLKMGVLENVDLQIGVDAFVWEQMQDRDTRQRERDHGFGDLTLASKINLWGNDGGDSAASLYPFLVLPTARHDLGPDGAEFGLMVPTAWGFEHFEIEFTPHAAAVRGGGASRYEGEFGQLTVLSRDLFGDFVGFVEFESIFSTESGEDWQGIVGTGITWEGLEDTVIEGGVGFGVSDAADDVNVFITLVQRFLYGTDRLQRSVPHTGPATVCTWAGRCYSDAEAARARTGCPFPRQVRA